MSSKIATVKNMRDFYPSEMRLRNWIEGHWAAASRAAGFEEWDCPILEHLDLYRRKSGDEIVKQLYTLTDGGGRELAIRPEMTPSLARMVAARQASLPLPIKWFCMARMCRYEQGQRGRLREFWQWNVDFLGLAHPLADAEVIGVALDALERMGLTASDVEIRLNSRTLFAALLTGIGLEEVVHPAVYAIADKRGKIPAEALRELYDALPISSEHRDHLLTLMAAETLDDLAGITKSLGIAGHEQPLAELKQLFDYLTAMGKGPYLRFDLGIVRGLAYYTGPVFEMFARKVQLRALCGGGRYDNLLSVMGGAPMSAIGFGMGDVVLGELLAELGKIPSLTPNLDYTLILVEAERIPDALALATRLRHQGRRVEIDPKPGQIGKALGRASAAGSEKAVLIGGDEWRSGLVRVKTLATGAQVDLPPDELT